MKNRFIALLGFVLLFSVQTFAGTYTVTATGDNGGTNGSASKVGE